VAGCKGIYDMEGLSSALYHNTMLIEIWPPLLPSYKYLSNSVELETGNYEELQMVRSG